MISASWFWCIGANFLMMLNKGYGWWDFKDMLLPGFVTGFFLCIACPVINYKSLLAQWC
jgi:hypothetical protein